MMHIFAKSPRDIQNPSYNETLEGHTENVAKSLLTLFGSRPDNLTEFGENFLKLFKLDCKEMFFKSALASCVLHDIGKANDSHQGALRGDHQTKQVIRHEHLSGLILNLPKVKNILNGFLLNSNIVFSAVTSHHLKVNRNTFAVSQNPDLKIFKIFPEAVKNIFKLLSTYFPSFHIDELSLPVLWSFDDTELFYIPTLRDQIIRDMAKFTKELQNNDEQNKLLMAVKSALILADSVGSGIVRIGHSIEDWLSGCFKDNLSADFIHEHIIQKRIKQIEQKNNFAFNDFQLAAKYLGHRALLITPCGSGKTLAAWLWIATQLALNPRRRVIFLYPTRSTTNEGFRDYVAWAPETSSWLLHSTSNYDLEGMFNNLSDERGNKHFISDERLFALQSWDKQIFAATVDQFLGFMQNNYGSICRLPILAESIIVFDEIHSFDNSLYSAFKSFLKNFDIPVLAMTASLPENRKNELIEECGMDVFPKKSDYFPGLDKRSSTPRYKVTVIKGEAEAHTILQNRFNNNPSLQVLWVANTIARCQKIAKYYNSPKHSNFKTICYHGGFKTEVRNKIQNSLIKLFQEKKLPLLAVTTQICEMSLDISADILICEIGPVTVIIQRFGRCKRHEVDELGEIFLYWPVDEKPYSKDEICRDFIKAIDGQILNQKQLADLLEKFSPKNIEVDKYCSFVESGAFSDSKEEKLRDDNDFRNKVVLDIDVERFCNMKLNKDPAIEGLLLSVPKKFATPDSRLPPFVMTAPSKHYDSFLGFVELI